MENNNIFGFFNLVGQLDGPHRHMPAMFSYKTTMRPVRNTHPNFPHPSASCACAHKKGERQRNPISERRLLSLCNLEIPNVRRRRSSTTRAHAQAEEGHRQMVPRQLPSWRNPLHRQRLVFLFLSLGFFSSSSSSIYVKVEGNLSFPATIESADIQSILADEDTYNAAVSEAYPLYNKAHMIALELPNRTGDVSFLFPRFTWFWIRFSDFWIFHFVLFRCWVDWCWSWKSLVLGN